jgi:hypothetical protein
MIFDNQLSAQKRSDNINEREQDNIVRIQTVDVSFDYKDGLWVLYYNGGYEFFENLKSAEEKLIYYDNDTFMGNKDKWSITQKRCAVQQIRVHSEFNIWHAHQ